MPKANSKCKGCDDHFYVCPTCDKSVYSKEGYCSYECWAKQPLLDRLEQSGQYEAIEEIKRLNFIINERR